MTRSDRAIRAQNPDGSFDATVRLSNGGVRDPNAFVTVLMLDHLHDHAAQSRALDYLQGCATGPDQHRFGFYPKGQMPGWINRPPPPDADDTALIATALWRHGRLSQADLQRVLVQGLRPHRLAYLSEKSDPWHQIGVFQTWLDDQTYPNAIDCTVNVNILTMLHALGGRQPEARAIRTMLRQALAWAGGRKARMRMLSPWYPEPIALIHAISRAAHQQVTGMAEALHGLMQLGWVQCDLASGQPLAICGSSDGRIIWTSHCLAHARRHARTIAPVPDHERIVHLEPPQTGL